MSVKGQNTYFFDVPVYVAGSAAVGGPMEGQGPLGPCFDKISPALQSKGGNWEETEIGMQKDVLDILLKKADFAHKTVDLLLGGDLINQLTVTNFAAKERDMPFLGLYNACATMAEGLLLAASLLGGGYIRKAAVVASSHNATSERQYRNPTELGAQRPMWSQWTVTAAGAVALSCKPSALKVLSGTVGRIVDMGVKDPNDMGAAMAPAAAKTITEHLHNSGREAKDYDLICTGDLGSHGHTLLGTLLEKEGITLDERFQDGGMRIYQKNQDAHAGGSGAGCSAAVWSSYVIPALQRGKYRRVLLVGTGALLSTVSVGQGKSIPAIAHAVEIVKEGC